MTDHRPEPSDPCRCGHTRDEHNGFGCLAIVAVHERTDFCLCIRFELDELSNAAESA